MFSSVMPCRGSRGCETGVVMGQSLASWRTLANHFFCRSGGGVLGDEFAGEGAGQQGRREPGHLPARLRQPLRRYLLCGSDYFSPGAFAISEMRENIPKQALILSRHSVQLTSFMNATLQRFCAGLTTVLVF